MDQNVEKKEIKYVKHEHYLSFKNVLYAIWKIKVTLSHVPLCSKFINTSITFT